MIRSWTQCHASAETMRRRAAARRRQAGGGVTSSGYHAPLVICSARSTPVR